MIGLLSLRGLKGEADGYECKDQYSIEKEKIRVTSLRLDHVNGVKGYNLTIPDEKGRPAVGEVLKEVDTLPRSCRGREVVG